MGFPSGPVVKHPPASVRDLSSIPGPGRFYMPWGNQVCNTTTAEAACTPLLPQTESQGMSSPHMATRGAPLTEVRAHTGTEDPRQPKSLTN